MIIDRYMLRQVLLPLAGVVLILSSLFAVFTLARFLTDASTGLLLLGEVFHITWLRLLIAQDSLIPIALYLGVVLVWGRLYQDLEMDALAAGGVGSLRLMVPLIALALVLTVVVAVFSTQVRPWAWEQVYAIEAQAEASAQIERMQESQFNMYPGGYTVFIEHISPEGELEGVFIRKREGGAFEMLSAPRGHFEPYVTGDSHRLKLFDALGFRTLADGDSIHGRTGTLTLDLQAATPRALTDEAKIKSNRELLTSEHPEDSAELQRRLSSPLSAILLLFAAAPLARTGPRQGRYGRLILAVTVYAVYFNLMGVARSWVEQGQVASVAWVHGLLILFVVLTWWRGAFRR